MNLEVDSRYRQPTTVNGTVSTDELYHYKVAIDTPTFRTIELKAAVVPRTFYTVVSGWNAAFQFSWNSTDFVATVAEGYYDATTLAAALAAAMNTAASTTGIAVTYLSLTNKFQFGATGATLIIYNQATGYGAGIFPYPGAGVLYGIPDTSADITILTGNTSTMANQANLSDPKYLYLDVDIGIAQMSEGIVDTRERHSFVVDMDVEPMYYVTQYVNTHYPQCERSDGKKLRNLHIRWSANLFATSTDSGGVTTDYEYPLSFNGIPHTLTFRVA